MKISRFAVPLAVMGGLLSPVSQGQQPAPEAHAPRLAVDLMSDTGGVDLKPYLEQVLNGVRAHWQLPSAEAAAQGPSEGPDTAIRVTLGPKGELTAMRLDGRLSNETLEKAAWAAILNTNFAPLPAGMPQQELRLRLHFVTN